MGKLEGKVAFVTGAARGQGRSHAVRLAEEGADIIAVDIADQISTVPYPMATSADLAETVRQVEELDRRIIATVADVRDYDALQGAVDDGVAQLGRLDIVLGNAGIMGFGTSEELTDDEWSNMIGTNLTGVFHTVKATIPHLKAGGRGGAIVLTSSTYALMGAQNVTHYIAAKTGVVGLMKGLALELAADSIRVNTVAPTVVDTGMIQNEAIYSLFAPELAAEERTTDIIWPRFGGLNALPIPFVETSDVTNAVAWLVSDEARYVTGTTISVDAGAVLK